MAEKSPVKRGCTCGVIGCVIAVLLGAGFVWLMWSVMFTNRFAKMMGEETYPVKGEPSRFDPIAAIPEITSRVGSGATLVEIELSQVRPDGTLDLMATYKPAPRASFVFIRKLDSAPEGKTTPPIGAGRTPDSVWIEEVRVEVYQPGQRRRVTKRGGNVNSEYTYQNEGMDLDRATSMAMPKAAIRLEPSLKEIWATAVKAGAPKDSVAQISYDDDGATFNVPGVLNLRWKGGKLDEFFLSKDAKTRLGIQ